MWDGRIVKSQSWDDFSYGYRQAKKNKKIWIWASGANRRPFLNLITRRNIHPSIFHLPTYPALRVGGGLFQQSLGEGPDTAGMTPHLLPYLREKAGFSLNKSHRQRDKQTSTHMDNLEFPVNLACTSLDCRRKSEYLEGTNTGTGRTCKQNVPDWNWTYNLLASSWRQC